MLVPVGQGIVMSTGSSTPRPRPRTVSIALGLFWATLALAGVKLGLTLARNPGPGGHGFTIFAFVATYSVMALLIVYLGMRASWARGALFALFLVAVAPGLPLALAHAAAIPWFAALTLAQVVAAVVGLFLVYREPAASWFCRPDTTPASCAVRRR